MLRNFVELLLAARKTGKLLERERIMELIDEARSVLIVDEKRDVDDELVSMLTNLMGLISEGDDEC